MTEYDSEPDTLRHIDKVRELMDTIGLELYRRVAKHDASKLRSPEKAIFDEWTPKLSGVTYGSDEYRDMLKQMKPAIDHRQSYNTHHPEFFTKHVCNGCFKEFREVPFSCDVCGYSQFTEEADITQMNLIDILEMVVDWKAATMRHDDGDIRKSLDINEKRFKIPKALATVLRNTVEYMGW